MGKALNGLYVFHDQGFYKNQDEVPYVYMNGKKTYLGSRNQYYRPGDRIILDTDKNGMISVIPPNQEDRIYAGSPLPTISGGIISSLLWKGFDLNVTLPYTLGRHVLYKGGGSLLTTDKAAPILLDLNKQTFWSETNPNTSYPVNRMATNLNNFASNLLSNVYKVNFIKLKLISLGYTLPEPIQKKLGFETRIFISGENIFTWSNYPGPDPESIDPVTGVDNFNNYPLSRKITFGLTLKF